MDDIVFFSTFNTGKHIELFQLFRDKSSYTPWIYYTSPNRGQIWNRVGDAKIWSQSHRIIKKKIIILGGYADQFLDLNRSNTIIYLASKPVLDHREILLLSKIDYIIAENRFDAFNIAYQVKYHNPKIKVSWLHPWTDTTQYTINRYDLQQIVTSSPDWLKKAFAQLKPKCRRFYSGTQALFCIEPSDLYEATQYLLCGRPILASRRFQELIIPGFNGYLVDTLGEALTAINALKQMDHAQELGQNGRRLLEAELEPYQYLQRFDKIINGQIPDLAPFKYQRDFKDRKWIVPEKILSSGTFKRFPENHHSSFQTTDLDDFNEIIEHFSKQLFSDVYVFGFWFPNYDRHELAQARNLVNRLGDRGRRIHFCLDDPIPQEWELVFNKLSIISREEGLKQVR